MKKLYYNVPCYYNPEKSKKEVSKLPSETIPDQSLTVREILEQYTRGINPQSQVPYYSDTEDFNDYDETRSPDFDLSDVTRIQSEILNSAEERKRLSDEKAALETAKGEPPTKEEGEPVAGEIKQPDGA